MHMVFNLNAPKVIINKKHIQAPQGNLENQADSQISGKFLDSQKHFKQAVAQIQDSAHKQYKIIRPKSCQKKSSQLLQLNQLKITDLTMGDLQSSQPNRDINHQPLDTKNDIDTNHVYFDTRMHEIDRSIDLFKSTYRNITTNKHTPKLSLSHNKHRRVQSSCSPNNKTSIPVNKRDDIYIVLWKLQKQMQSLKYNGHTTAFKHFRTSSEAQRFNKTMNELSNLKQQLQSVETSDQIMEVVASFMSKMGDQYLKDKYQESYIRFSNVVLETDVNKVDPRFSLKEIVDRIFNSESILEDQEAAFKNYRDVQDKIKQVEQRITEIEQRRKPKTNHSRLASYCSDAQYYDISDIFWKTQNPTALVGKFEHAQSKISKESKHTDKLHTYIQNNQSFTQPTMPPPGITKQFPLASIVGRVRPQSSLAGYKQDTCKESQNESLRKSVTTKSQGGYQASQEKKSQKINLLNQYKAQKVRSRTSDIMKELNTQTLVNLGNESVLQRNKLLLENVIFERKKTQDLNQASHSRKIERKRPPSILDNSRSDYDNNMIFIKDDRMIYF